MVDEAPSAVSDALRITTYGSVLESAIGIVGSHCPGATGEAVLGCAEVAAVVALVDVGASASTGTGARAVTFVVVVIGGRISLHLFLFPLLAFFSVCELSTITGGCECEGIGRSTNVVHGNQ